MSSPTLPPSSPLTPFALPPTSPCSPVPLIPLQPLHSFHLPFNVYDLLTALHIVLFSLILFLSGFYPSLPYLVAIVAIQLSIAGYVYVRTKYLVIDGKEKSNNLDDGSDSTRSRDRVGSTGTSRFGLSSSDLAVTEALGIAAPPLLSSPLLSSPTITPATSSPSTSPQKKKLATFHSLPIQKFNPFVNKSDRFTEHEHIRLSIAAVTLLPVRVVLFICTMSGLYICSLLMIAGLSTSASATSVITCSSYLSLSHWFPDPHRPTFYWLLLHS